MVERVLGVEPGVAGASGGGQIFLCAFFLELDSKVSGAESLDLNLECTEMKTFPQSFISFRHGHWIRHDMIWWGEVRNTRFFSDTWDSFGVVTGKRRRSKGQ